MEELVTTPVFVGLTRPAMAFGIPMGMLIVEGVFGVSLFSLTGNPLLLLFVVPVHLILMWITSKDLDLFSDFILWSETKSSTPWGNKFWGCVSLAPAERNFK